MKTITALQKLKQIIAKGELDNCFLGINETSIGQIDIQSQSAGLIVEFKNKKYHYYKNKIERV